MPDKPSPVRTAILSVFSEPEDPPPPRRITISVSAALYDAMAVLAHKLHMSWSATASLLLNASITEALEAAEESPYEFTLESGHGITSEQSETLNELTKDQRDEVMRAFSAWAKVPPADRGDFLHPLLREAQIRDEVARRAVRAES